MSAVAAHTTTQAQAPTVRARGFLRTATSSDAVVLSTVLAFAVVLAALTWGRWGDLTMDTGYDLVAASRTAHGELPYIDYNYFYGPLGPLVLGGLYAITGTAVWPAVLLGFAMALAAIVLTFRLAREFSRPLPSALAAALVAAAALSSANNSYILPHSTSAPLATVSALGALLCLVRWARDGRGRLRPIGGGVLIGLALATRPELALPLLFAVGGWLALQAWRAGEARSKALRGAALVLGPAMGVGLGGYAPFLTAVSAHDLVLDNLYPQDFVRAAGHVVLEAHAPLTAGSVAELAARLALYAAGCAGLLLAGRAFTAGGRRRTAVLALSTSAGLLFCAVLAARPETVRYYLEFAYGWIPAGAWLAVAALAFRTRSTPEAIRSPALLVALVLAAAVTTTYASFNPFPNAVHPEATPYLLPLAAVFLAWLHTGAPVAGRAAVAGLGTAWLAVLALASAVLVVHDALPETFTVHGPHGSLAARPADGPALQGVLDAIAQRTRAGDPVLLAPQMTALYTMSGRRDPLAQLSLLPGALADAAAEDGAIARLRDVRVVAIDSAPLSVYHHGAFGISFDRRLAAYVGRHYRHEATFSGVGPAARRIELFVKDPT